jgi:hypothetical protein
LASSPLLEAINTPWPYLALQDTLVLLGQQHASQ